MIALTHLEKQAFLEVFPEQCLKSTPDPEFLSNLYGFDMSLCLLPIKESVMLIPDSYNISETFKQKFDAINSTSRVPEMLVWMQSQVCDRLSDDHCSVLFQ